MSSQESSFVRPKSLTALAAKAIRDGIVTGRYPLGSPLYEKVIADAFGVSKTPIREAMVQLQNEGLVRVVPHSGSFVFSPTVEDIDQVCELRIILEENGLCLAMRRARENLLADLRRHLDRMRAALAEGEGVVYRAADAAFHHALVANASNAYLLAAYARIEGRIGALRVHVVRPNPHEAQASFEDHGRLLDALERAREADAVAVLRQHVGRSRDLFRSLPAPAGQERGGAADRMQHSA